MTIDRKRLRELALMLTDKRHRDHGECIECDRNVEAFGAAADPQTILALLDALEAAEQPTDDARRLDWLDANPREATIRIGSDMKACVFYGVSCDPRWSARDAIDAAIAQTRVAK